MIILINGSYAVGKTMTAERLVERLYHSMLYDPQILGSGLAHIIQPIETFTDFQDLTAWRPLVIETATDTHTGLRKDVGHSHDVVAPSLL